MEGLVSARGIAQGFLVVGRCRVLELISLRDLIDFFFHLRDLFVWQSQPDLRLGAELAAFVASRVVGLAAKLVV